MSANLLLFWKKREGVTHTNGVQFIIVLIVFTCPFLNHSRWPIRVTARVLAHQVYRVKRRAALSSARNTTMVLSFDGFLSWVENKCNLNLLLNEQIDLCYEPPM